MLSTTRLSSSLGSRQTGSGAPGRALAHTAAALVQPVAVRGGSFAVLPTFRACSIDEANIAVSRWAYECTVYRLADEEDIVQNGTFEKKPAGLESKRMCIVQTA